MRTSDGRPNNSRKTKEEYLSRVSILRSQSKWCCISVKSVNMPIKVSKSSLKNNILPEIYPHLLMMNTVHMLVQPFCMQNPMSPVKNKVLKDKVEYYLR